LDVLVKRTIFLSHYSDLGRKISTDLHCPTNLHKRLHSDYIIHRIWKSKGDGGYDPPTSRSAGECSATELYSRIILPNYTSYTPELYELYSRIVLHELSNTQIIYIYYSSCWYSSR
jgi:hypothetical protein